MKTLSDGGSTPPASTKGEPSEPDHDLFRWFGVRFGDAPTQEMRIATQLRLGGFSFAGNLPLINIDVHKETHGDLFRGLPCVFCLFTSVSLFAGCLLWLDDVLDVAPKSHRHLLENIHISGYAASFPPGFKCPNGYTAFSAEFGSGDALLDALLVDGGHILSHCHSSHWLRLLCPHYYNACAWFRQSVIITIHLHCNLVKLAT